MEATNNQQPRKTSKGRRKIEIKKIEKESSRYVTFSKRKNGLFNKATELSTLCGSEIAMILFTEHGRAFSCGHPDMDKVLDQYLAETDQVYYNNSLSTITNNNNLSQTVQEQEYLRSINRLEEEKRLAKMCENMDNMNNGGFWWEGPIDRMDKLELQTYKESLQELRKNVQERINSLEAH